MEPKLILVLICLLLINNSIGSNVIIEVSNRPETSESNKIYNLWCANQAPQNGNIDLIKICQNKGIADQRLIKKQLELKSITPVETCNNLNNESNNNPDPTFKIKNNSFNSRSRKTNKMKFGVSFLL